MIDRLIAASARHRAAVLGAVAIASLAGLRSLTRLPVDALPDIGETQVIVHAAWDRSPDLVDAHVTAPIVAALLSAPGVKSVRGTSDAGESLVSVTFDAGVAPEWARSRTLEWLSAASPRLPAGVKPALGPDATPVGWVFQYALVDRSGTRGPGDLRALHDWYLRTELRAVPGVADVGVVGGAVRQFQVNVDVNRLRAYGLDMEQIASALREGNRDTSGQVSDPAGAAVIVRGLAAAHEAADLEQLPVTLPGGGTAIRIGDVARVVEGTAVRRGVSDLDGEGDVVSGVVVMRDGQNALDVVDRVKAKLGQAAVSLPAGVEVVTIYDRSALVRRAVNHLTWTIAEVMLTVVLVILVFLAHLPSAAVPLLTLPVGVLIAFAPLSALGIGGNVMSLAGLAIAIGALVDGGIIMAEQTHTRLEAWHAAGRPGRSEPVILEAIHQIGRPSFYALLVIAVSFLPVLALEGEEGRLFRPLAVTKTVTMLIAAVLAVTLDPALRLLLTRDVPLSIRSRRLGRIVNAVLVGRIRPAARHPLNSRLGRWYQPVVGWALDRRVLVCTLPILILAATLPLWSRLGSELTPTLDEGTLLYMPATLPGISPEEAASLLALTDRALARIPEVERVLGKAGRADTATDPAPLSMLETVIVLRPVSAWRRVPTWYSSWAPDWLTPVLRPITSDRLSKAALIDELNDAVTIPGLANTWSMPIRGRHDMLTTGVRTPLGVVVSGPHPAETERIAERIAGALSSMPGTRTVFAERMGQGRFVDVVWDRAALTRAGLDLDRAQAALEYATAGRPVTEIVRGRERYAVQLQYAPSFRAAAGGIAGAPLVGDGRAAVSIGQVAEVRSTAAPLMVRNDGGRLSSYVYIDPAGADVAHYMRLADRALRAGVPLPAGYTVAWGGRYEETLRTRRQLMGIVPLTIAIICVLLYACTRSIPATLIVLLAVPFSAIGAIWILFALGYAVSTAVWIGLIALMGIDAGTGVFMLLYLDDAYDRRQREGRLRSSGDLRAAVLEGAAGRLRPRVMTVAAMLAGLLPILWSSGPAADVMTRIAAPMIGGICSSFVLQLLVYPAIYYTWKARGLAGEIPEPSGVRFQADARVPS